MFARGKEKPTTVLGRVQNCFRKRGMEDRTKRGRTDDRMHAPKSMGLAEVAEQPRQTL
jgi:hypothetical protein